MKRMRDEEDERETYYRGSKSSSSGVEVSDRGVCWGAIAV
jgi:hypothetical protein